MMSFNCYFVCVILIVFHELVKAQGDNEVETKSLWWPYGCFVYGTPNSDESGNMGAMDEELTNLRIILYSPKSSDKLLYDEKSIQSSGFSSKYPVKIIIHGWQDAPSLNMTQLIKQAYFSRSQAVNVIAVDWSQYSMMNNYFLVAKQAVPKVGFLVSNFIGFLMHKFSVPINNIHVIGHSLGAQIAGFAGQYFIKSQNKRLSVIMGLDPALPYFQRSPLDEHLDASDADYVEIIHTAAGCKGFDTPIGTADFYPNFSQWKRKQPGCGYDTKWECSHARVYLFFAESVMRDGSFESVRCKNLDQLERQQCDGTLGWAFMGGNNLEKKNIAGIYYLKTNAKSPFSMN